MAYPIKFLLLQKSELVYEVAIRGEAPSDNVEGLRRQVTKLTQLYPSEDICESVFEFSEDLKGSNDTLDKIRQNLESLKTATSSTDSLVNRTRSLFHHLYYRLSRIVRPDRPEIAVLLEKVQDSFQRNFTRFSTYDSIPNPPVPDNAANATASASADFEAECPAGTKVSVSCDRGVTAELAKLKYDGKSCVRAFIQRLDEFRTAKGLSEQKMLLSAIDLFTGDALHWYRATRTRITDWKSLLVYLKDDFDVADYDYRMSAEIRNRSQGDNESVSIYFAIMEGMFSRLNQPMGEADKLEILLHNIRPCYSTIIAASNVTSVDDLKVACKNYERIKVRSDNFKEPPSVGSGILAPEFCYSRRKETPRNFGANSSNNNNFDRSRYNNNNNNSDRFRYNNNNFDRSKFNNNHVDRSKPQGSQPQSTATPNVSHRTAPVAQVYCYRCKLSTHTMRDCPAERTIFCFRCGKKDVRRPDCPNCSTPATKN